MKVITAYPVIQDGKEVSDSFVTNTMNYSSSDGMPAQGSGSKFQNLLKQGAALIGSGKVTGAIQSIRDVRDTARGGVKPAPAKEQLPPPPPPKKGLSTGAKIGIAVGAVAVLGTIAYFLLRNKGGNK
jgi:hypothetical protein